MAVAYDKYSVTQYSVSSILGYIEAGDIAIPEIQRPFVWKGKQVRDLIDSLYNGYPTGYLVSVWFYTLCPPDRSNNTPSKPH